MCGYCGEAHAVVFVKEEMNTTLLPNENIDLASYFFESKKLTETIERQKIREYFDFFAEIALYRVVESLILNSYKEANWDLLGHFSDQSKQKLTLQFKENKQAFFTELFLNSDTDTTSAKGARDLLVFSEDRWNTFISDENTLIKAEGILGDYYNDYLDPDIANVTDDKMTRFYNNFINLFSAFLIIVKYKPESEALKKIALNDPRYTPSLSCCGLWLQRKAYCYYVQAFPFEDIADNFKAVRVELLIYTLLFTFDSNDKFIAFQKRVSTDIFNHENASVDDILNRFL